MATMLTIPTKEIRFKQLENYNEEPEKFDVQWTSVQLYLVEIKKTYKDKELKIVYILALIKNSEVMTKSKELLNRKLKWNTFTKELKKQFEELHIKVRVIDQLSKLEVECEKITTVDAYNSKVAKLMIQTDADKDSQWVIAYYKASLSCNVPNTILSHTTQLWDITEWFKRALDINHNMRSIHTFFLQQLYYTNLKLWYNKCKS